MCKAKFILVNIRAKDALRGRTCSDVHRRKDPSGSFRGEESRWGIEEQGQPGEGG